MSNISTENMQYILVFACILQTGDWQINKGKERQPNCAQNSQEELSPIKMLMGEMCVLDSDTISAKNL